MEIKSEIYNKIHESGQRVTNNKKILIDVLLSNRDYFLSVNGIINKLSHDSMDTATVYRILQSLHSMGIIETTIVTGGITKYKICDSGPHHHMICTICGKVLNFPCDESPWENHLKENNFTEETHKLEIYGVCEQCSRLYD